MIKALFVAVASLASAGIVAATVDISVVERGAGPVVNQLVSLFPATPDGADRMRLLFMRPAGRCTTNASGRCEIGDLRPGVYFPQLIPIADPNLTAPAGSPMSAYGTVTVMKPDAKGTLRIELERGVRVQFRLAGDPYSPASVALADDSGKTAGATFSASGAAAATLGSGHWVAHLDGPAGALVASVELDGGAVDTLDVPIELIAPSSDRFVTWTLKRPCVVSGKVTSTRKRPAVRVGAMLVAPGPWGTAPWCRGMNCAGDAPSSPVYFPPLTFEFRVPSGTWRVAPRGDTLLESNPPYLDVNCGEGERVSAHFDVRETEAEDEPGVVLHVIVVSPDGLPAADVPVEVWPSTGNLEAKAPLAIESTASWGVASFTKLAAGSYLLRARRSGYKTAVLAVPDLEPGGPVRGVRIQLDKGAAIDAIVRDPADRPVTGVGLNVKWIDDASGSQDPITRLAAPEAVISVPPSKDQSGHVVVTGLTGGTYEVTPVLSGAIASATVASVETDDGAGRKDVVVRLGDHETRELNIRVRPAPSLAGRLVCKDGGLLPHLADACVLGLPPEDEDDGARDACRKAVISPGQIALSGNRRDTFRVGPLTEGSYRLGLRPNGYSEWTWALGTPDGAHAAVVQVSGTDAVDLGGLAVFCGPAVELRPSVLSRDPLPDLTVAKVEAELTRTSPSGKIERQVLPVERGRDRVVFRELPEGAWTLKVTMSHPFFLPAAPVVLSIPVALDRGVLTRTGLEIAAVGGAVVIDTAEGTARLSAPDGSSRVAAAKDGAIAIEGVAPDSYHVEMCEDSACARVLRRWDAVRVLRGQKVILGHDL